jgi:DNA-binding transcriptional ArsR family regulator
MARHMPNHGAQLDSVFRALSDPTRRAVLERLSSGTASVSELAEPFEMALPSFLQHLRVLKECGLVRSQKRGRVRTYAITPEPLNMAETWMAGQRALWDRRLHQLDDYLQRMKSSELPENTDSKDEECNHD